MLELVPVSEHQPHVERLHAVSEHIARRRSVEVQAPGTQQLILTVQVVNDRRQLLDVGGEAIEQQATGQTGGLTEYGGQIGEANLK